MKKMNNNNNYTQNMPITFFSRIQKSHNYYLYTVCICCYVFKHNIIDQSKKHRFGALCARGWSCMIIFGRYT